jgi:hypothetical protein
MTVHDLIDPANIPNLFVHLSAGLKKENFLERVASVRAIRRSMRPNKLTWYPATASEWCLWEGLHNAVNKGDFGNVGLDECYPFGLILPRPLHSLLERNDLAIIQRQVIAYLATILFYDPNGEKFISEQVYRPVYEMAQEAKKMLYTDSIDSNLPWDEFLPIVDELFMRYIGAATFEFLRFLPHAYRPQEVNSSWWIDSEFNLGYGGYYFTQKDWETLIVAGKADSLLRCESDKVTWDLWLHAFRTGKLNKGSEASFFATPPPRGSIYVIRQEGTDHYKIGWTTAADPMARLASLQTGSPNKLLLIGYFAAGSQATEWAIHNLLSIHRTSGEWFTLNEENVNRLLNSDWRRGQQIY